VITDPLQLAEALSAPFDLRDVHFKPQVVKGDQALAVVYIDARAVMDRLDAVFGVGGWQDAYEPLSDGCVMCRLRVKAGGEWVVKEDVGAPSEQPDPHDKRKAAVSDELKRAAIKLGIGRYLYHVPPLWAAYDPQKKRFTQTPRLPDWALPRQRQPQQNAKPSPQQPAAAKGPPADAAELARRLREKDAELARAGLCGEGDLIRYVAAAGVKEGWPRELSAWPMPAGHEQAARVVKAFVELRQKTRQAASPVAVLEAREAALVRDGLIVKGRLVSDACRELVDTLGDNPDGWGEPEMPAVGAWLESYEARVRQGRGAA
jgi:hypothetical protein